MNQEISFYKREGVLREKRQISSTDFDYAQIDERDLGDMLVYIQGLSKLLKFHNADDKAVGDLSFLLKDEMMVLAAISYYDLMGKEELFLSHLKKITKFKREPKKKVYLKKSIKELTGVLSNFNSWLMQLNEIEQSQFVESMIRKDLIAAINSKLAYSLERFKRVIDISLEKKWLDDIDSDKQFKDFRRNIWDIVYDTNDEELKNVESISDLSPVIQRIFQSVYEVIINIKNNAYKYMEESFHKNNHQPHIALLLTFVQLYGYPQNSLNNFTKRYLDYYFGTILKMVPRKEIKDQVFLNFILNKDANFAKINEDQLFSAGQNDSGEPIEYKVDYPIVLNNIKIKKALSYYLSDHTLNDQGNAKKMISNIFKHEIPVKEDKKDESSNIQKVAYPPFGERQEYKGEQDQAMDKASLGFIVSSPALFLNEGKRNVQIRFEIEKESYKHFDKMIRYSEADNNDETEENLAKVLNDLFKLQITGEEGWKIIPNFAVSRDVKASTINIAFVMEENDGKIVNFDPEIHKMDGAPIKTAHPSLILHLNENAYRYGYSFLNKLQLNNIYINTTSTGIKNIRLYNNLGEVSQSSPFLPFGPKPVKGSYLLLGSGEVFMKKLKELKINMEWYNLTENAGGLYEAYKDYELDIDNTSFEINVSNLEHGQWQPDVPQEFKLFRTKNTGDEEDPEQKGYLSKHTILGDINVGQLKFIPDFKNIYKDVHYDHLTQNGFIKIELSGPQHGFGHDIYPSLLSEVSMHNAKTNILKLNNNKELPKEPITPELKAISIDYIAETVIPLDNHSSSIESLGQIGEVFHILPDGHQKVFPTTERQEIKIIPSFEYEGALMLGLLGVKPMQTVSILFNMQDESSASSEDNPPEIKWEYLHNNKWGRISSAKILMDTTNGFLKTGVTIIELPYEISNGNDLLDPELFWIRASVQNNIHVTSHLIDITTQVVTATILKPETLSDLHPNQILPEGSIKRSTNNIIGVQKVEQPLDSDGGISKENETQFYTRVSERLRHRARAVSPWDFERLILDKFPEIEKVTCLPNINSRYGKSGNTLLVVSPKSTKALNSAEPMVNSETLYNIKSHIKNIVSPFIKVETRNPAYERVKVICAIKFKHSYNYGFYLQKVKEDINSFILGNNKGTYVELGGSINVSDIVSFIKSLEYVEFITKFSMIQTAKGLNGDHVLIDTARKSENSDILTATQPWAALVPAQNHQIEVLNDRSDKGIDQAGITDLELGQDFIID
ncbi:baseplate J/gp47 family protein [Aureibacter tunicatorum]|uniref:Baseplate protein J-like domain-containing protein n=1 Tax=Aureibacter tunicatorum TaxID=866807 RepID=A0AAE3XGY7_9BACT|nr:baseplate J/gp47 family protein [Aureibacter tunicatorum]MDR6237441.1 hypothetical protein [Aureibacter tunicatorum]BDD06431.1 hypothetical protein AUTU_39140 [Aureibacter tunicatorum]